MACERRVISVVLALVIGCTGHLFGQDQSAAPEPPVSETVQVSELEADGLEPPLNSDYGTSASFIMQVPAAAFQPRSSSVEYGYAGQGYVYYTLNPARVEEVAWAPLTLPSGAQIVRYHVYLYDADPSYDLTVSLRRYYGYFASNIGSADVFTAASSGSLGYVYLTGDLPTPHTVDNDIRYSPADVGAGSAYTLVLSIPPGGLTSNLRIKSVEIWWKRQVSPAPGVATFADVPPTDPYFRFVEALAAAGITSGCGSGDYCPDDAVTRAQMAVFLAQALGLHYQH